MKKKVDQRIRALIENGPKTGFRSLFILIGDKGKDQVVNLHHILSKSVVRSRPNVLWCYKKELGFSSHRKKRMKQIKREISKGLRDIDQDDPFELFIATTEIRYTYYKESQKILGNTYGMCVLQDFEALTPNLLARTIETVEGGGIIVILLKTMSSLRQLYTMTMDVHNRFRTNSANDVTGRFNERFILSLGRCENCLVVDDELNILPISSSMSTIVPIERKKEDSESSELKTLKESLRGTEPVWSVVNQAKTLEQAKALLTFIEAISEKTLRSTVSLTAARGRGKSAALGLAIAAAIAFGYSNIFVTSPSPENLRTLFDFIFKGVDVLNYKEHTDFEILQSTNPEFNKAIVRVNFFHSHRQTIQYISPEDHHALGQAELLVIDEAAAIPLPIVKNLFGPYLVFLSSTINGYEGTGRSLSLKLINQLRQHSSTTGHSSGRVLREVELKEPIRYAAGDPIEKWLNELLCLDASILTRVRTGFPHPNDCDLYYVSRDTLFSYHKASENFLQRLVALFVSSHYKNSPDDLLLMSDAPAHHLFVLLGPVENPQVIPEILCAVQVCLEGQISKKVVSESLVRGRSASGDLIPWTISQQFQDQDFPSLSGARIVRIATHPDYQRMKYGSRALEILESYFEGNITNIDEELEEPINDQEPKQNEEDYTNENSNTSLLLTEEIKPRKQLPPLLVQLKDRRAERLNYIGVSFGVTPELFAFWKKNEFSPVYLRQSQNDLTGEHTCIMLKALRADDLEVSCAPNWLELFCKDFRRRFLSLLSYSFRTLPMSLALSILVDKAKKQENLEKNSEALRKSDLDALFSPYDLKRLESYAHNLLDFHVILDMLPTLSRLYFLDKLSVSLSAGQCALLVSMGLQCKSIEESAREMNLQVNQVLALFQKSIRKISQFFRSLQEQEVASALPVLSNGSTNKIPNSKEASEKSLNEELQGAEEEVKQEARRKRKELLKEEEELSQYSLSGKDVNFEKALSNRRDNGKIPSVISVKKSKINDQSGNSIPRKGEKHNDKHTPKKQKKGKKHLKAITST